MTTSNTDPSWMELSPEELAKRIRSGDREITQAVVKMYLPQVLRTAMGAGLGPDRAEDVVQSTFATFVEKASSFDGRSHVRTWIFGILYRKILEARRELKRQENIDDIDEVFEARFQPDGGWARPPSPVDRAFRDTEIRERFEECLEDVPMRQQLAFILREVEGFSMNEICEIMQFSRSNLGVSLHRGRNHLRECLEAKGLGADDGNV